MHLYVVVQHQLSRPSGRRTSGQYNGKKYHEKNANFFVTNSEKQRIVEDVLEGRNVLEAGYKGEDTL